MGDTDPQEKCIEAQDQPGDIERPLKRGRTLDVLGSKGLLKRSEFIRLMIDALNSLGYNDLGARLAQESDIDLHPPAVKLFLNQVDKREWDESIATLQRLEICDEKFVKFLLLEQKVFDFVRTNRVKEALSILRKEIEPLGVNTKRVRELVTRVMSPLGENTESETSSSKVMEKVQNLFPPGVIIPERRLENILENTLDNQLLSCTFHNIPDKDMSLSTDHRCWDHKLPSVTVQILEGHTDEVVFLKFAHHGKYLASSSRDKTAIIWEINAEGKFLQKHKLEGHTRPVVAVLWSPLDQQVITCGQDENIRLWDVDTGAFVRSYEKNGVRSVSCAWCHDGRGIIGAMSDRRVCLWNLDGTERVHVQGQRAQKLSDVAMTSDGKWLVSMGSKDNEILLFDMRTGAETRFQVEDTFTSFSLSKDNTYLLIDLISEEMSLWYIQGYEPYKYFEFNGHKRGRFIIRSCFGGYKDTFIASGSEDSQVYIWHRSESLAPRRVLPGHAGAVNCVSWNPTDMHMLASGSDDRTIRIWGLDKNPKDRNIRIWDLDPNLK